MPHISIPIASVINYFSVVHRLPFVALNMHLKFISKLLGFRWNCSIVLKIDHMRSISYENPPYLSGGALAREYEFKCGHVKRLFRPRRLYKKYSFKPNSIGHSIEGHSCVSVQRCAPHGKARWQIDYIYLRRRCFEFDKLDEQKKAIWNRIHDCACVCDQQGNDEFIL